MKIMNSLSMKKAVLFALFGTALVTGCNQNPFPAATGTVLEQPQQNVPAPNPYGYAIQVSDEVNCNENATCAITVTGLVPDGMTPVLSFTGLPSGASFDGKTGKITYVPNYNVVDVSKDPTKTFADFPVTATVQTINDPISKATKQFTIRVNNVNRPLTLNVSTPEVDVMEGATGEEVVTAKSDDHPAGPFSAMLSNQPDGMVVEADPNDVTAFHLRYSPSRKVVTAADTREGRLHVKVFKPKLTISTGNGQTITEELNWKVTDDHVAPVVIAPTEISQGPVVNFTLRAEDMNGEAAPVLTSSPSSVPFGRITITQLSSNPDRGEESYPSVLYSVTWDQIRTEDLGEVVPLKFAICSNTGDLRCVDHTVTVTITGNSHPLPTISRTAWPVSQIGAIRVGQTLSVPLGITDPEDSANPVTVQVLPVEMQSVVKWDGSHLTVSPTAEGIGQFTLVVHTVYEQTSTEGFIFEALPASWSSLVVVSGYGPTKESRDLITKLGRGEILSGAYQMTPGMLRLRDTMIITSDALTNPEFVRNFANITSPFKTVLVSSPAVGNSLALVSALEGLGVKLGIRVQDDPLHYILSVGVNSSLPAPSVPAGLNGTLTAESGHPQTFLVDSSSRCRSLFNLQKAGASYSVGVSCDRSGTKFVVLGFEFLDLALDSKDEAVSQAWLIQWIGN